MYIDYVPADRGRLTSHYAYWKFMRLTNKGYTYRKFTVTHREAKEPVLQQVFAYVKAKYGINMADKDVFGAYHPEGTLIKLTMILGL